MVYQSVDKNLLGDIRKIGCFYLDGNRIGELEAGRDGSIQEINDNYMIAYKNEWINNKTNKIEGIDNIINTAIKAYGGKTKVYQVGILKNGKYEFWQWAKRLGISTFKYGIIKYNTSTDFKTHFTLTDSRLVEIYDPYSPKGLSKDLIIGIEYITLYQVIK